MVTHKVKIKEGSKSARQALELKVQIKHEIKMMLVLSSPSAPNLVGRYRSCEENNAQIRCYIDFHDVNKECPKDEFHYQT